MSLEIVQTQLTNAALQMPAINNLVSSRKWYAVFTVPQNEKSVVRHLEMRDVESFLPTYETVRVWKNRQRVKTILPLFPTYLFVRIEWRERVKVLQSPGVVQIVGGGKDSGAMENTEIELLRNGLKGRKIEPYRELVVGQRVRIKSGLMEGAEGTLVRRCNGIRFVLTLAMINQHAAIEVDADALELVSSRSVTGARTPLVARLDARLESIR